MIEFLLYLVLIKFCVLEIAVCVELLVPEQQDRVCVIGAGYSGLGTARYLQNFGLNFTVFEATRYIGGTWRFDPQVGQDEDGVPIFTSMYKNCRTSTPYQTMEYKDFPFHESSPVYPSGKCFYKYLENYTENFALKKHIEFRKFVKSVTWADGKWKLKYLQTDTNVMQTEECNFVVVANGFYNIPKTPEYKGQEFFEGKLIHSHDYKEVTPYINRTVLIVGAGETGFDLALLLSSVSNRVFLSHHRKLNQNVSATLKPGIERFTPSGVFFEDGSFEKIDDVIFCTGFNFDHTFLGESSGLVLAPKSVMPLYQHMVNIDHPSMVFVGKAKTPFTRLYDAQAEYVAALAAGTFKLPTREAMIESWTDHVEYTLTSGSTILKVNAITEPDNYLRLLQHEAGVNRDPVAPDYLAHRQEFGNRYVYGEDVC